MFKAILWIVLLLCIIGFWKGYDSKESILPLFGSKTVVIEYTDGQDLLTKLRDVETGRKVEMRQSAQGKQPVDTGISCNDVAAKTAYMERMNREHEQLNKAIETELTRIHKIP